MTSLKGCEYFGVGGAKLSEFRYSATRGNFCFPELIFISSLQFPCYLPNLPPIATKHGAYYLCECYASIPCTKRSLVRFDRLGYRCSFSTAFLHSAAVPAPSTVPVMT